MPGIEDQDDLSPLAQQYYLAEADPSQFADPALKSGAIIFKPIKLFPTLQQHENN